MPERCDTWGRWPVGPWAVWVDKSKLDAAWQRMKPHLGPGTISFLRPGDDFCFVPPSPFEYTLEWCRMALRAYVSGGVVERGPF